MMRRSWMRLAMANAGLGVASIVIAGVVNDPDIRWALTASAVGSFGIMAWALRSNAKSRNGE